MQMKLSFRLGMAAAVLLMAFALWGCAGAAPQQGGEPLAPPPEVVLPVQDAAAAAQTAAPAAAEPEPAAAAGGQRQTPPRDPFAPGPEQAVPAARQLALADAAAGRDPFRPGRPVAVPRPAVPAADAARGRDPFRPVPDAPLPEIRPELPVEPLPAPPPEPPAPPPVVPGQEGPVILELTTLDRCWLEVIVDGELRLRNNVPRGETLRYAGRNIRLEQVGREWALRVTLNGKDLGVLQDMVPLLVKGPVTHDFEQVRVRVSLDRRHRGGVLLGLGFTQINN